MVQLNNVEGDEFFNMRKFLKNRRRGILRKSCRDENDVRIHGSMHIYHYCVDVKFKNTAIDKNTRKFGITGFIRSGFLSAKDPFEFQTILEETIKEDTKENYYDELTHETPEIECIIVKSASKLS